MTERGSPWWVDAVVYQVYPRSFRDLDGDGEGDLPGITHELASLEALGADALWLSPFYPSPMADSGYDISDHRAVDPRYGTLEDFDGLVRAAHDRGIRVLVDLVPNHVSVAHPWFAAALEAEPGSRERARFHFADGRGPAGEDPPTNWRSVFTGSAWSRITEADGRPGQWYLHLFDTSQPDLNWDSPDVRADLIETLRFWLDRGVDGFRVDVAMGMAKDMAAGDHPDPEGLTDAMRLDLFDGSEQSYARRELMAQSPIFDVDDVHGILRQWRRVLDEHDPDLLTVGEAWTHPAERARRYTRPGELRQTFNFDFLVTPWEAADLAAQITATLDGDALGAPANWALDNHDTARVATRLGGGAEGLERARALALLTLALPGTVYLFQGQELGLEDAVLPDASRQDPVFLRSQGAQLGRDGARVPLPWRGDHPPYGFSPDGAAPPWLPQPDGWVALTRDRQSADGTSTLSMYRAAIGLRRSRREQWRRAAAQVEVLGDLVVVRRGDRFASVTNCSDSPVSNPADGAVVLESSRLQSGGSPGTVAPRTTLWIEQGSSG